jgi:hypothetical protein
MEASAVPVVVFVSRVIHVALLWDGMGSVVLGSVLGSSMFSPMASAIRGSARA